MWTLLRNSKTVTATIERAGSDLRPFELLIRKEVMKRSRNLPLSRHICGLVIFTATLLAISAAQGAAQGLSASHDSTNAQKSVALATVNVTAPQHVTPIALPFTVPISTADVSPPAAGADVISYQFILTYDPAIILPQNPAVTVGGTISENGAVTINQNTNGILNVVVTRANPFMGDGILFNFKFTAIGTPGQISPLTWQNFQWNEGNPADFTTNGQVRLTVLSSANVPVGGRVLTASGQPVSKASITLTDANGITRTALSNPFGYYRFDDIEVGQTYFLAVSAKGFSFNTQVVNVSGELTEVDLIANP